MRNADDFDGFCLGTQRRLLGQLYAMTGDRETAEECLQEAYARAWQRWSRLVTYEDPAAWVRTVAFRLATNRWHRAQNAARAWRRDAARSHFDPPSEDTVALVAALRQIPAAQREAVVLHYLGDLSVAEIARQTAVPEGTVKARLSRGRTALAELLGTTDASEANHA